LKLYAAQLHGDEPPEAAAELGRSVLVIKAFRVEPDFPLKTLDEYHNTFAFLFDAAYTGQYGGTGRSSDWDVASARREGSPYYFGSGLKVENVAAASASVRPYGIDVASGVES